MSSVAGAFSQVAPFKRWIVGADAVGKLYSKADGTTVVASPAARTVLKDMGKTVFLAGGGVLRKVAVLPTPATTGPVVTGYIWISDTVPAPQNITLLN